MDETLWKPELLFICVDFWVIVDILMTLNASPRLPVCLHRADFVVFSAKYFWWSNVRSVFLCCTLAASVQALTLKSESGILQSWCVCWSAAQTLSPGGHEGRFKMQLDKLHPKDRLHTPLFTNLDSHSEIVTILNFRNLELHPHWHLPGKKQKKTKPH